MRSLMGIDRLVASQPQRWSTNMAEEVLQATVALLEGEELRAANKLIQILWRFKGLSEGASPATIEESVKTLAGTTLPKAFRKAQAKFKIEQKKTTRTDDKFRNNSKQRRENSQRQQQPQQTRAT
jgi:hypothetical protein